jgi:hypothetical protein
MPAGGRAYYSDLGRIVARGRRSTATGNITTTETGVIRLDNVPVFDSRAYMIASANLNVDASVANDIGELRYRVTQQTTPGTSATTSSTQMGRWRSTIDDATNSNVLPFVAFYYPSADGYLSVLLSAFRAAGSGNIVVFANNVEPIDLVVVDLGPDPGDTGVVI